MASGASSFAAGYIQTGVQGVSRFTIQGDPRRMFLIPCTGGMVDWGGAPNADLSPLYYNGNPTVGTAITGGGVINLYSSGGAAFSYGNPLVLAGSQAEQDIVLAVNTDGIINGASATAFMHTTINQAVDPNYGLPFAWVNANGEQVGRATVAATGQYGGSSEQFTVAGTVTMTAGSATVTGAGTNFTTATLPGYAYTPSRNLPAVGDVLAVTQGANTYFHRIVTITSATVMTVYPIWGGTTAGGLTYQIGRTGYGSHSNIIQIKNTAQITTVLAYYVGNINLANAADGSAAQIGTIQCAQVNTGGHFMCPQTSAAIDVQATDIALYKSYLLYGYRGSISWSVAGFPTSFATGFGATDFPAGNTTVVDIDDDFIAFEYLGDQLVALFRHSCWLVQPTGSVPEFNFYKLPIPNGAMMSVNSAYVGAAYQRPSCSAPNSIFYTSDFGLHAMTGAASKVVSGPVNRLAYSLPDTSAAVACTYEPMTHSVIWHGYYNEALSFSLDLQQWSRIRLGTMVDANCRGMTALPITNYGTRICSLVTYRRHTASTGRIISVDTGFGGPAGGQVTSAVYDWSWNSSVISLGDDPDGFTFGGCQVEGDNVINNVSLRIYAGRTPYTMELWGGVITVDAMNNRQPLGKKTDAPFVAFKVSGTKWAGLTAIHVYDGRVAKGR